MKFPVRMVGKHGAMHAYSTSEVANLQSLGWSVEEPDPVKDDGHIESVKLPLSATLAPLVLPVVDEPPKRKPGRPAKAK